MTEWTPKRFWKEAKVTATDGGFTVLLDGRGVRTPAKAALTMPTEQMARAVAVEWDAQTGKINPLTMPFTRSANAAIDKVAHQHGEVADMLAAYGDADLLCYRATEPAGLVARQAAAWDPLLDWAAGDIGARLVPVSGVMHAPQDADTLRRLQGMVHEFSNFQLAAFHDLVSLSGSLIVGFAAARGASSAGALWALSQVDETWQEEQWGEDELAQTQTKARQAGFLHAYSFFEMS